MSMTEQYLPVSDLDDNLSRYIGRRIKLKLKKTSPLHQYGATMTCIAGYYDEHAIDIDDEEEDEFMGYGILIDGVALEGVAFPHLGSIAFADIAGFRPLEGENTEEEKERWFQSARG